MAKLAIQQFGSIEKYTEEMKHNLKHFSEIMEKWQSQISEEIRREDKFLKLASHKGDNVSSKAVQQLVRDTITGALAFPQSAAQQCGNLLSNDYLSKVFDTKHGAGSSEYIVKAFPYYSKNNCIKNN